MRGLLEGSSSNGDNHVERKEAHDPAGDRAARPQVEDETENAENQHRLSGISTRSAPLLTPSPRPRGTAANREADRPLKQPDRWRVRRAPGRNGKPKVLDPTVKLQPST